jgi:two-component system CheB/CheR fusion protein
MQSMRFDPRPDAGRATEGSSAHSAELREARLRLLSRVASDLLASEEPQSVVDGLCVEVMRHLDCQVFFNFLLAPEVGRLRLNAWAGVSPEVAAGMEWIDLGQAICGCAARDGERIVCEDVQRNGDPRDALARSHGMQAYCANPLLVQGRSVGTLSFGTRTRTRFAPDELELMRTVADQVATAMQRVEAQRALSQANAQLREADQRKNEFLAILSHELRNPLAPIRNSVHVLERAAPGSPAFQRARSVIDRQVTHLTNLVDDLLDVTRITRNKIQLFRERLELNDAVRRAAEDARSLFEEAGVRLELALDVIPTYVSADRTRLAQIIGNLLQNAAKFSRLGGRTRVSTAVDDGRAVIRVADDGVGMTPEVLGRLFQPFVQAEQTLERSRGGLGLGLALVKGLAELHGGSVEARSGGPGRGSELVIRLPPCASPAVSARLPTPVPVAPRRRVLVIEDNVDAAQSLKDLLELHGHDVAIAHDGPAGLDRARAFLPDVVFCDIGLPGMDGFEVARSFGRDDALQGAYLVALSGYALPEDLARAEEAGFRRHLAKPPSLEAIEELLVGRPSMFPRERAG